MSVNSGNPDCTSGMSKLILDTWLADTRAGFVPAELFTGAMLGMLKAQAWSAATAVAQSVDAELASFAGTPWTALPINTNQYAIWSASPAPVYRRMGRLVIVRGLVKPLASATIGYASTGVIATLPGTFRSEIWHFWDAAHGYNLSSRLRLEFNNTGALYAVAGSIIPGEWLCLDTVFFAEY